MRVAIVGAGAIGCAYGAVLHEHGHDVVLIDVWREHVAAIDAAGLAVEGLGRSRTVAIAATTEIAAAGDAEVVLVLVKAFANDEVAGALAPLRAPGAIVVTVQNGIGNDVRLGATLGCDAVVQGSTTVGAKVLGPGRVELVPGTLRGESETVLGRPRRAGAADACERFADALTAATLPAEIVDDVRAVVWRKVAFAAAIGPMCATLQCTVAEVMQRPSAMDLLRQALHEIVAVAGHEGVVLDAGGLWAQARGTYRSIGAHPPSLAVAAARGRRTEIESQLGEVIRRGAPAGIPTPAGDVLTALVRAVHPLSSPHLTKRAIG